MNFNLPGLSFVDPLKDTIETYIHIYHIYIYVYILKLREIMIDIDIDIVYIYNYLYLYQYIQYTSMFSMPLKAMLLLQLQALRWFASLAPWAQPRRTLPSSWRASRPPWGSWHLIPGDMASILARSSWCDEAYGYIINNDMHMFVYVYIYIYIYIYMFIHMYCYLATYG